MERLVVALVLVGCSGDKPGTFHYDHKFETKSNKMTGLPGGPMGSFDDAKPALAVTGAPAALVNAIRTSLEGDVLVKRGAVNVELVAPTSAPSLPSGTMRVHLAISAVFAAPPKLIKTDATIIGDFKYSGATMQRLGAELAEEVTEFLGKQKLPANVGPPTGKPAKPIAITVGNENCTLHEDGAVRCWSLDNLEPSPIEVKVTKAIDSGNNYGLCGIRDNGRVYCMDAWDNSMSYETRDVCGVQGATSVSVGSQTACATTDSGRVYCWPGKPSSFEPCGEHKAVEVVGVTAATTVDTGPFNGCVLTKDGGVQCWEHCGKGCKSGVVGQIDNAPTAAAIKGVTKATSIVVGFAVCAAFGGGKIRCVDRNTKKPRDLAVPEDVKKLVYGNDGTCALGAKGHVYCWNTATEPTVVAEIDDVVELGGDITGMCAINGKSEVLCWGTMGSSDKTPKPVTFRH